MNWWPAHGLLKRRTKRDVSAQAVSRFIAECERAAAQLAEAAAAAIELDEKLRQAQGVTNRPRLSAAHIPEFRFTRKGEPDLIQVTLRKTNPTTRGRKSK
jgi:hypothetical protein